MAEDGDDGGDIELEQDRKGSVTEKFPFGYLDLKLFRRGSVRLLTRRSSNCPTRRYYSGSSVGSLVGSRGRYPLLVLIVGVDCRR